MHQNPLEDVPACRQILRAESQRVLENNVPLAAPQAPLPVALEPLAHKEYLSPSLHLNKSSAAVPSNRTHGHLVLFHTRDGD